MPSSSAATSSPTRAARSSTPTWPPGAIHRTKRPSRNSSKPAAAPNASPSASTARRRRRGSSSRLLLLPLLQPRNQKPDLRLVLFQHSAQHQQRNPNRDSKYPPGPAIVD